MDTLAEALNALGTKDAVLIGEEEWLAIMSTLTSEQTAQIREKLGRGVMILPVMIEEGE